MSIVRRAAFAAAFLLSACGGGGGDGGPAPAPPPPPPAAITPAEAVRLSAQAVMDLTALAWALSTDAQMAVVTAPAETVRTVDCAQGGRNVITRPAADLLRIEHQACAVGGVSFSGLIETEGAVVTRDAEGTNWAGTVRWSAYRAAGASSTQTVSGQAVGSGFIEDAWGLRTRGQPLTLQLSALTATRTPDALGRGATLASSLLNVQRIPVDVPLARDLYALDGCVTITASGVAAELCVDAGSRIALLENLGDEQLTGRLRWNAGTPAGFDARLRVTPGGGAGSTTLRIELDLDGNGSYEAAATLDRSTDIGLRL